MCGPSFEALLQAPDREQALGSQQAPAPGWAADCRRAPPRTRGTSSEISGWSSWRFRHGRTNLSFISIVFFETAIWKRDYINVDVKITHENRQCPPSLGETRPEFRGAGARVRVPAAGGRELLPARRGAVRQVPGVQHQGRAANDPSAAVGGPSRGLLRDCENRLLPMDSLQL